MPSRRTRSRWQRRGTGRIARPAALSSAARGAGFDGFDSRIAGEGIRAALEEADTIPGSSLLRGANGPMAKTVQEETANKKKRPRTRNGNGAEGASVSEPFLERRPYNAAADFVDANVARGHGEQARLHRSAAQPHLWRVAAKNLPLRIGAAGAWAQGGGPRRAAAATDNVDYPVAFWGAIRAGIV